MEVKKISTNALKIIVKNEIKRITMKEGLDITADDVLSMRDENSMNEAPLNVTPSDVKSARAQNIAKYETKIEEMYETIERTVRQNFNDNTFSVSYDFDVRGINIPLFREYGLAKLKSDLERNGFIDVKVNSRLETFDGRGPRGPILIFAAKFSMPE
jgi:hypothetical protein